MKHGRPVVVGLVTAVVGWLCLAGCEDGSQSGTMEMAERERRAPSQEESMEPADETRAPEPQFGVEAGGTRSVDSTGEGAEVGMESGGAAPPAPSSASSPAAIEFVSRTLDFGTVLETESPTAAFRFRNVGGATLRIKKVSATCGCTAVTPDRLAFEPGESGELEVTFTPTAPGDQKKLVTVLTNGRPASVRLEVVADVKAFAVIEPRIMDFGTVRFGRAHRATVQVTPSDPEGEVVGVRVTNEHLTARLLPRSAEPTIGDAPVGRTVEVLVPATMPWGGFHGFLEFAVLGRPSEGVERVRHVSKIRVRGQAFGELSAEPDTVRYGIRPGESFERRIRLWRPSGSGFEVIEATASASRLSSLEVAVTQVSASEVLLVVHGVAGDGYGSSRGELVVSTSVPGEERLRVPIVGVIRERPVGPG